MSSLKAALWLVALALALGFVAILQLRSDVRNLEQRMRITACIHTTNGRGVPQHETSPTAILDCVAR